MFRKKLCVGHQMDRLSVMICGMQKHLYFLMKLILHMVDLIRSDYLVTDVNYYVSPYPSILSCSLDGSVYQRLFSGEGRVVLSNAGCINSCVFDSLLGYIAAGGQSGEIVVAQLC